MDRKKIKSIASRWAKLEKDHASEVGRLNSELKAAKDDLADEAEAAGAKKRAFKAAMKKQKLLGKAEEIGFADDQELDQMFDEVQLVLGLIPDVEGDGDEGNGGAPSKVVDIGSAAAGRA